MFWFWRKKPQKYPSLYKKIMDQPESSQQTAVTYPPPANGVEVKSLEEILAGHKALLRNIDLTTETGKVFEEKYWPAIERYAQTVHLLPASENAHHSDVGGLLHHGLEVGFYTMAYGRAGLYGKELGIKKRDGRERWLFACFMAGLCHDLGKVVADVKVTSESGTIWSPHSMKLLDWVAQNQVKKYFVDWVPERHKRHEQYNSLMSGRVLTDDDSQYIDEIDRKLLEKLMLAIAEPLDKETQSNGPYNIKAMLKEADSRSVQEDKKKSRTPADLGLARPKPMIRHYWDGMRRMLKEGKWQINESGGAAWVMGSAQELYLVWPRCGVELYNSLLTEGVEGSPAAPEVIADILGENDLLVPSPDGSYYWRIKPANIDGAPLTALRIKPEWAPGLVDLLPLGLNGLVDSDEGKPSSWSYVGMDDMAGSASERPAGQAIKSHPIPGLEITASPEMHDTPVPAPKNPPIAPSASHLLGPVCRAVWDAPAVQAAEAEKPAKKRGGSTHKARIQGTCIGVLGVIGALMYFGKHWYGDELSYPYFLWAAWQHGLKESLYLQWAVYSAAVIFVASIIYPFVWTQVERDEKKAKEILDLAEQEVQDKKAQAEKEIEEMKAQAEQEASMAAIRAEVEAAEVLERAGQDTRMMVSEARKKTKDLWSWAEAKAKDANVTPEEWKEVKEIKKKAQDILEGARQESAAIVARDLATQSDQQEQGDHVLVDQPVREDLVGAETSPDEGMDDQGQGVDQVAALEEKIMGILFGQPTMKKRDLERKANKFRYGLSLWESAMNNLLTERKIVFDLDSKTYRCHHD